MSRSEPSSTADRSGQRRIFLGTLRAMTSAKRRPAAGVGGNTSNREPLYERGCRRFPLSLGS